MTMSRENRMAAIVLVPRRTVTDSPRLSAWRAPTYLPKRKRFGGLTPPSAVRNTVIVTKRRNYLFKGYCYGQAIVHKQRLLI